MGEQQPFGKHWIRLEEGIVFLKYSGQLSLSEIQRAVELMAPALKQGQGVYMLSDVSDATGIEPAGRKFASQWLAQRHIAGAVNFGAGTLTRAAAEMITRVLRLLHRVELPTTFTKTEAEARAWIAAQQKGRADDRR